MNISIIRYRCKSVANSIDGTLYIDGDRICDTAENAKNHIPCGTFIVEATKCQVLKRNIPVINIHKDICRNCEACSLVAQKNETESLKLISAISYVMEKGKLEGKPEAVYMAEARAMEASQPKHAPRDPMPFCPQIKSGNSAWNTTDGSILVGQYLQPGVVLKSRPMFEAIYERIRKNIERGNEVKITIVEDYKFKD